MEIMIPECTAPKVDNFESRGNWGWKDNEDFPDFCAILQPQLKDSCEKLGLCDDLEGWDGRRGGRLGREGKYV